MLHCSSSKAQKASRYYITTEMVSEFFSYKFHLKLPYMVKWAPGGAPGAKTWTSPPESNEKWAPLGAQIKLSARGADFTGPHFTGGHYRGANTNGRWFYGLVFSQFLVRMSFWASWCYGRCEQLALPKTGPEKPIPWDFSCIFLLSH